MWIFNRASEKLNETERLFKSLKVDYEKQADGTYFVPGDLTLANRDLAKLPDLSNVVVGGNFDCSNNLLTSLRGSPKEVRGDFRCDHNILLNFEGVTQAIGGRFDYGYNHLLSQDAEKRAPKAGQQGLRP